MSKNLLRDLTESRPLTLAQARALLDNPPAEMTDKMKRRLASFVSRYERQGRTTQRERYAAAVAQMKDAQAQIEQRLTAAQREVVQIERGLRTGSIDHKEGQKGLAAIFRQINQDRAALDGLDASQERALAMIETDPARYQAENLQRFPLIAGSLPVLSVAWLAGEDDRDPLGDVG